MEQRNRDHDPSHDHDTLQNHDHLKETVAFRSILVSAIITIAKGIGGVLTGSLALISDALHSLLDVVFTTITWLAIRKAHQPADDKHHFGHGKIESVAALIETVFLLLLAGIIAITGWQRLVSGSAEITTHWFALMILVVAIGLDGWRWLTLKRVARKTNSEALEADALHFASDLVNSAMVLAAFGAIWLGFKQADSIAALIVAAFIAVSGVRLAVRTINTLIDTAPAGLADIMREAVETVPGVALIEKIRVRPVGGNVFGEIKVRVSRTLPLDKTMKVKNQIYKAIEEVLPNAEITLIAEPIQLDDETLFERVMLISAKLRLPLHNVIIQNVNGKLHVGCDLEVDGRLSLAAAHTIASKLESAIRNEFGDETDVETHIEPLRAQPLISQDIAPDDMAEITKALKTMADSIDSLSNIHSIKARLSEAGMVVTYHCKVPPTETVADIHRAVDQLERKFRTEHPEVIRVIGHAEPRIDS